MILRSGKRIRAGAPPRDGAPALILPYIGFFFTSILKPQPGISRF